MSRPRPRLRRAAQRLIEHAVRVMPRRRAAWARAMCHELDHVRGDGEALRWAFGCVLASYLERIHSMNKSAYGVSRWVLSLEMLTCFIWLTLMFVALLTRGAWGFAGPLPIDFWFVSMLLATVLGPLGLAVGFKVVVLGQSLGGPALLALCVPVAWTVVAFGLQASSSGLASTALHTGVLFALLPAIGVAHLLYLARRAAEALSTARAG